MNTKRFTASLFVLISVVFSLIPTAITMANDASITLVAQYRQDVRVTLDLSSPSEISSLDPAIASDDASIEAIDNLFLRLTDLDPITNEIRPELATSWTVSEDGLVWTFYLRNDVMWMQYDPATGNVATIRPVVAADFVFGIKRACDPRFDGYNQGYYRAVLAEVLDGCNVVNSTPVEDTTDELVFGDTTQIHAIDDTTLEIQLQFAAGYFLSITTMAITSPLPQEALEDYGDEWTLAGNIVTNGPYFLEENVHNVRRTFVRNEALPSDLAGEGNIDHIIFTLIEDGGTAFALYQDNQLDMAQVPAAELQSVLESGDYVDQLHQLTDDAVFFFAYTHDKAPFDNVHVRRAFSAIIDRQAFVDQIRQGRGVPMIHFTPPGIVNSPPIDDIGVGFDPDYAREHLALAGYPDCEGFPNIDIITYTGAGTWGEFWAAGAEEHLGCDPALFNIEQVEYSYYDPNVPDVPVVRDSPNAWTQGWTSDSPDADSWFRPALNCEAVLEVIPRHTYMFGRTCDETDLLIEEATREPNPERRAELYLELEERLFGEEGEFPIAPIYIRARYDLFKTWYTGPIETDGLFGGRHWEAYSIDMAAKLAARDAS